MKELNETGALKLDLGETVAELCREDLLIETAKNESFETVSDRGVTVVLDKQLTPELIEEGNVREIISKIQTMRKDSGFEVMDNVYVAFSGNDKIAEIALRNKAEICSDTLAVDILVGTEFDGAKSWNVNGETVTVSVKKA